MRKIILLFMMYLSSIGIFAQNGLDNEHKVYISKPTYYGQFILEFAVIEGERIIYNPSFHIKFNKKRLKKIVDTGFVPCINCKVSHANNGNVYTNTRKYEYYTTENFNNYLAEEFKANEKANFFNRTSLTREVYLMACPHFFEMTNEERLQYFLEHVEK